jgi:hypothetical protein
MLRFLLIKAFAAGVMDAAFPAEIAIPSRKPPAEISVQKSPPNCER